MTKQAKRTTLETLGKVAKSANRKEPYYYGENDEYVIFYHPVFSQSKRQKLVKELLDTIAHIEDEEIEIENIDEWVQEYHSFLIIKYFTEMYDMLVGQSLQVHIQVLNDLKDSSLMELLLYEAFDQEEIDKVIFDLENTNHKIQKLTKELESAETLMKLASEKPGLTQLALKAQQTKRKKKK